MSLGPTSAIEIAVLLGIYRSLETCRYQEKYRIRVAYQFGFDALCKQGVVGSSPIVSTFCEGQFTALSKRCRPQLRFGEPNIRPNNRLILSHLLPERPESLNPYRYGRGSGPAACRPLEGSPSPCHWRDHSRHFLAS
jgi:hypothetical protein